MLADINLVAEGEVLTNENYVLLDSNYVINNNNTGDNLIQLYISSLVIIPRDVLGEFTLEEFKEHAFTYDNYTFDINQGELVVSLSNKIPIECVNSDYTIEEIYEIYKNIYVSSILD